MPEGRMSLSFFPFFVYTVNFLTVFPSYVILYYSFGGIIKKREGDMLFRVVMALGVDIGRPQHFFLNKRSKTKR